MMSARQLSRKSSILTEIVELKEAYAVDDQNTISKNFIRFDTRHQSIHPCLQHDALSSPFCPPHPHPTSLSSRSLSESKIPNAITFFGVCTPTRNQCLDPKLLLHLRARTTPGMWVWMISLSACLFRLRCVKIHLGYTESFTLASHTAKPFVSMYHTERI